MMPIIIFQNFLGSCLDTPSSFQTTSKNKVRQHRLDTVFKIFDFSQTSIVLVFEYLPESFPDIIEWGLFLCRKSAIFFIIFACLSSAAFAQSPFLYGNGNNFTFAALDNYSVQYTAHSRTIPILVRYPMEAT
jgi:hypothetical protein